MGQARARGSRQERVAQAVSAGRIKETLEVRRPRPLPRTLDDFLMELALILADDSGPKRPYG